jgi:hypothetical protein
MSLSMAMGVRKWRYPMIKIHVQLRGQGERWSSDLSRFSKAKFRRALSRVAHDIHAVNLRIEAISGRRGRRDCLATVVVHAHSGQRVVLHRSDACPERAISELVHAARRSLGAGLKKQRSQRRKGRRERASQSGLAA